MKNRGRSKKQGIKLFRKKRYREAVSLLEKALSENGKDPDIHLYLGYASILTGDWEGARRYFRSGLELSENHLELMKGLAYLYLRDERVEDAISLWGEILENRPRERNIRRSLQLLRESEDVRTFAQKLKPEDYLTIRAPLSERLKPYRTGLLIAAGIIIVLAVFFLTPLNRKVLQRFRPDMAELEEITLPPDQITVAGDARYSLSEDAVRSEFVRIKKYIYRNKVNTAIIALNRVMLSNASPLVKERFKILYEFIGPADPLSLDSNPDFSSVMKEPDLYLGAYVLWTGKIAGLEKEGERITFDLLVNYENEDTIEGIAEVGIEGVFHLANRGNVEVFGTCGRLEGEKGRLKIRGIFIRDLGP